VSEEVYGQYVVRKPVRRDKWDSYVIHTSMAPNYTKAGLDAWRVVRCPAGL